MRGPRGRISFTSIRFYLESPDSFSRRRSNSLSSAISKGESESSESDSATRGLFELDAIAIKHDCEIRKIHYNSYICVSSTKLGQWLAKYIICHCSKFDVKFDGSNAILLQWFEFTGQIWPVNLRVSWERVLRERNCDNLEITLQYPFLTWMHNKRIPINTTNNNIG